MRNDMAGFCQKRCFWTSVEWIFGKECSLGNACWNWWRNGLPTLGDLALLEPYMWLHEAMIALLLLLVLVSGTLNQNSLWHPFQPVVLWFWSDRLLLSVGECYKVQKGCHCFSFSPSEVLRVLTSHQRKCQWCSAPWLRSSFPVTIK